VEDNPLYGRKIFFLYPPSVVQEEMVINLLREGYEVYLLRDHEKCIPLLKEYPDSVFFVNLDQVLSEIQWQNFICRIIDNPLLKDVKLGVLTYNQDPVLEKRFTEIIKLPYGYIVLKISTKQSLEIILKVLEMHGTRGRRKYVRVKCDEDPPATFYVKIREEIITGRVLDISIAGMACVFDSKIVIPAGTAIEEIHINLHQVVVRISGTVFVVRGDVKPVHVILFNKDINELTVDKILTYIHFNLQHFLEKKLESFK